MIRLLTSVRHGQLYSHKTGKIDLRSTDLAEGLAGWLVFCKMGRWQILRRLDGLLFYLLSGRHRWQTVSGIGGRKYSLICFLPAQSQYRFLISDKYNRNVDSVSLLCRCYRFPYLPPLIFIKTITQFIYCIIFLGDHAVTQLGHRLHSNRLNPPNHWLYLKLAY